jgi:hypothetical protein
MYDFLCVLPHNTGSHSLTHYINQHRQVHLAPDMSISRADDVLSYERYFRPWVKTIGVATKDFHLPERAAKLLSATKRDLLIQTVRDPVQSLVAAWNYHLFAVRLRELAKRDPGHQSLDDFISRNILENLKSHAVEVAYEADSFKEHLIIDVEELRGEKAGVTVRGLWVRLAGNADPQNLVSAWFAPLGSRQFTQLKEFGTLGVEVGNRVCRFSPMPEGQLWTGYFNANKGIYNGWGQPLITYPDPNVLLPSLKLSGPLHMCPITEEWLAVHPMIRDSVLDRVRPWFENHMRWLDGIFFEAEKAMTFSVDDLTPAQADKLKIALEPDFAAFRNRHASVADRWLITRKFLGV